MRVPDDVLQCVFFLCTTPKGRTDVPPTYRGTGFIVGVSSRIHKERVYHYLVTAKHTIQKAKAEGLTLWARLNLKSGGSAFLKLDGPWRVHTQPASDVAVLQAFLKTDRYDFGFVMPWLAVTRQLIDDYDIGVGDELFMVGLFAQRQGHQQNRPIVRSGILASMPSEPFTDDLQGPYHAYLVEVRSLGGLSGSPVFVSLPEGRVGAKPKQRGGRFLLLGLLRAHYEYRPVAASDIELNAVNKGIAVVTPATDILDVLASEDLTAATALFDIYTQMEIADNSKDVL